MSLRGARIALDESEFQATLREAAPGMLPVRKPKQPIKEKNADVLDLYAGGVHVKQIAALCEMHTRDIRRMVAQARLRGDPRAIRAPARRVSKEAFFISLPVKAHRKIREAAESRGLDDVDIVCRLVELIAADNLIEAILDDGDDA